MKNLLHLYFNISDSYWTANFLIKITLGEIYFLALHYSILNFVRSAKIRTAPNANLVFQYGGQYLTSIRRHQWSSFEKHLNWLWTHSTWIPSGLGIYGNNITISIKTGSTSKLNDTGFQSEIIKTTHDNLWSICF